MCVQKQQKTKLVKRLRKTLLMKKQPRRGAQFDNSTNLINFKKRYIISSLL